MNKPQITLGQWTACPGLAKKRFRIETSTTGNECEPIATLTGPDREANAKAIAALPRLLNALERLAGAVSNHQLAGITISSLDELCEAQDQANEALRLAGYAD